MTATVWKPRDAWRLKVSGAGPVLRANREWHEGRGLLQSMDGDPRYEACET